MSRPDITESVISVIHRPPTQRNLPADVVDVPETSNAVGPGPTQRVTGSGSTSPIIAGSRVAGPGRPGTGIAGPAKSEPATSDARRETVDLEPLDLEQTRFGGIDLARVEVEPDELDADELGSDEFADDHLPGQQLGVHDLGHGHVTGHELGVHDLGIDGLDIDELGIDELAGDELAADEHGIESDRQAGELVVEPLAGGRPVGLIAGRDADSAATGTEDSSPRLDPQLVALAEMNATDPRHGGLRRAVIEAHLPLVHHLAQRFRGRGEPYDDLVQVGTIGLLHAVDRYDPGRGSFASFAVPTIVGEIRRHFRDRGWALRIPRRVQDLGRRVSEARETLTHGLDRSPTVSELASYLQVDSDLVLEALETASAYITVPLPITADESDRMARAFEDSGLELVEQRETLRPLLARLPERQQRILEMRFFRGMSQSQIASEIGVSQMHVSRLLAKSLSALRSELTEEL